jgi:hypothetical protein
MVGSLSDATSGGRFLTVMVERAIEVLGKRIFRETS